MNFTQAIYTCLRKYANFYGRASRSEFWWFYFLYGLTHIVCYFLPIAIARYFISFEQITESAILYIFLTFFAYFIPAILFWPALAVMARRLHDVGRTGWWTLLSFPIITIIIPLIFCLRKGDSGENKFGTSHSPFDHIEFVEAIKIAFAKTFTINARATRREFWYFVIFVSIIISAFMLLLPLTEGEIISPTFLSLLIIIAAIVLTIPFITLAIRRIHDIGRTPWVLMLPLLLFAALPFLPRTFALLAIAITFGAIIVLIVWFSTKSEGENKYGKPTP